MDMLQKIGGRKFLIAVLAMGAGLYLELSGHPLSVNMTGLLVGLVGAFSAANYAATAKHFDYKGSGDDGSSDSIKQLSNQVADLSAMAQAQNNEEDVKRLVELLQGINNSITQVQQVSGQMGVGIVGLSKEVGAIKRAVSQPTF